MTPPYNIIGCFQIFSEKNVDLMAFFGYNGRACVLACASMCCCGLLAVEHRLSYYNRRCNPNEAYLPAQPSSSFQGSWFPSENGYFQRPQGSGPPSCKGPQGSVRLMSRPRGFENGTTRSKAKRELQRGECKIRPAPFLGGQSLEAACRRTADLLSQSGSSVP